jgi:hypothetical protein
VAGLLTADDLLAHLGAVTTDSDAKALVRRAVRIAGVPADRPLDIDELLRVCEALASEGGMIQQIAELIASRALKP